MEILGLVQPDREAERLCLHGSLWQPTCTVIPLDSVTRPRPAQINIQHDAHFTTYFFLCS